MASILTGSVAAVLTGHPQGWFSVRRELKITMMIFLVLCIGYLVGYGVMFVSDTFRWTFVQWRFFSLMAMGSVVLNVLAFILGVICRVNFGKGLRNYRKCKLDQFLFCDLVSVLSSEIRGTFARGRLRTCLPQRRCREDRLSIL
jgi:hypothetical protein